jgi:hypothetical protein
MMCLIRTLRVTRDAAEGAVVAEVAVAEAVEVVVVAEAGEEVHQPLLHRSLSNQVISHVGVVANRATVPISARTRLSIHQNSSLL